MSKTEVTATAGGPIIGTSPLEEFGVGSKSLPLILFCSVGLSVSADLATS